VAQESIEQSGQVIYLKELAASPFPEPEIEYAAGFHAGILSHRS
jgi:hypothetical protein